MFHFNPLIDVSIIFLIFLIDVMMKMIGNSAWIVLVYVLLVLVMVSREGQGIQLRDEPVAGVALDGTPDPVSPDNGGDVAVDDVPTINAPYDHPVLPYVSVCGIQGEIWIDLMKHFLSAGDVFFDLTAGFGLSFIPLATHVGKNGSAIAFERNETVLQYLNANVGNVGIWDRVLFLPDKPTLDTEGKLSPESEKLFNRSYLEIVQLIGDRCPQVVILREHGDLLQGLDAIFARLPSLLEICSPVLYFDVHTAETINKVEAMIQQYSTYQWYVESLCCLPKDSSLSNRYGLLAIPNTGLRRKDYSDILRQYRLIPFINRHRFASFIRSACDVDQIKPISASAITAPYFGKVVVDMDMLIPSFTATACVVEFVQSSAKHMHIWHKHHTLIHALYEDVTTTADDYVGIMTTKCQDWITGFFNALAEIRTEIPDCTQVYSTFDRDVVDMTSGCIDFASERISFLYKLHSKRIEAMHQMRSTTSIVQPSQSNEDDEFSPEMTMQTLHRTQYYPYSEFHSFRSWFERLPFENNYHRENCGEPVFCGHAVEFMKLINKWQNPPKTDAEAKEVYLREKQTSPLNISRTQFLPPLRSCENAKYLVYEVASSAHGLGSMFGLIATALRYAICHDRILVLNIAGQYPSLLKWRPGGCKGATFECYFEPITHCTLTKQLLLTAYVNADGQDFNAYPYRDYKVLGLRGLPSLGPCSVCFEGMPKDIRFFDGYYIASYNAPGEATYREFTNMNAFMSTIKLPWISNFMRYFLRPRPWVVEAMREIVMASMMSPTITTSSSGRRELINKITQFPKNFISMHVRHGMKIVEVDLVSPTQYMNFIQNKFPLIRDIFISTETEYVIHELAR